MYYWFIPFLAAIANTLLCAIVYRNDPRNAVNKVFSLTTATIISWNLNIFSLYYFSDSENAFYWSKVFRTGTLLMPPTVVHLFLIFGGKQSKLSRAYLILAYGLVTFLILANAGDQLVSGVRSYQWGYYPVPYRLYTLHTLSVVMNFSVATVLLILNVRNAASAQKRLQAKFWLLGAGTGILAGTTNLLPIYHIGIFPLGNFGNVAYTAIVAYAIVRHRLMDIDLVVTKGVAYAAVSFGLIAPAWIAALFLQRAFFGRVQPDFSFALLVMLVTVGVLFPTFRARAESRLERSLFREKHEHRAALVAFTHSIVRILDREKLVRELASTLSETLVLDRIAIAVADEAKRAFVVQHALGLPPTTSEFSNDHEFVVWLQRRQESVLRDELEGSGDPTERAVVAEICRHNGWEVCVPLTVGGKLIGFMGLGRKRNRDAFFAEDLDLLGTLAAEASVAMENARLYEELKRSQDIIRRADRLSALGTLAAGIAHEVRNPLVSIQTFFQLAPDRLHDEEFFTTFLSMTANEVKRISDLISELLSFARSPTRSLGPVNLNEAAERVATLLEPEARKHKIELTRTLSPSVPIVRADADQVKQVLINLVLNGIQATHPNGQVSVTTRSVQRGTTTFGQIEIRDTGIGIPKDQLDDIFNPFFTTKDKGTGLGLAIAHQIVMEHGGFVSVDSTEGEGTSFCVDLPAFEGGVFVQEEPAEVDLLPGRYGRLRKIAS